MSASQVFPFREPRIEEPGIEERHYLPPPILGAVRREAAAAGASDWVAYAQAKLDRELRACSLLLNDEQVAMLRRYAAVLGAYPQDILCALLAPGAAQRERQWHRAKAFARTHAPRRPLGCLALVVWPATLVGLWTLMQWAASLLPLLIHR